MNLNNQNLAQVSQELKTIQDYIRWTFSLFNSSKLYYGHGTDNAWDEAVNLILTSLHLPPDTSSALFNSRLTMVERKELCELIFKRIDERIPVAYLTKQAWFAGLPFYVDKRVIIPRSPLAELIEKGFSPWLDHTEIKQILDLCTGSACIAIACALAMPQSEVDAVDLSKDALEVAKINVDSHRVGDVVNLIHGDLFEPINKKYDLIISNPPYISREEYETLPSEYHHEPAMALKAEEEGLGIVKNILKKAGHHLQPNGILVVEVGNSQELLSDCFPMVPFLWLEFEKGGEGVFMLTKEQLEQSQSLLES